MMEGWKEVRFGEITELIKRGVAPKYSEEDGYVVINQKCIRDGVLSFNDSRLTSKSKKVANEKFVRIGDVLINSTGTGTLGRTAPVKKLPDITTVDTHVTILRGNEKVDNLFLGYLARYYEPLITLLGKGATNQIELGASDLKVTKVVIPESKNIQRKIASILSAYDDLIENNLKRIKLLEEKAQLTYEEWFSVKGTPDGWKEYNLGKLIDYHIGGGWGQELKENGFPDSAYVIRGTDMDNLPFGSIEKVPFRWHKSSNLKSRRLTHGDIVFEVSGGSSYEGVAKSLLITNGLLNQFDRDTMCASFCKLMRPKSISHSFALILFLKYLRKNKGTEIFEKRSASNIVNYNWEAFLKFQKVKMPDDEILKKFNGIVEPMITSIYNLGNQNTKLKEARDILLPRLMSGMVDVDEIVGCNDVMIAAEPKVSYNKINEEDGDKRKALAAFIILKFEIDERFGKVKFEKLLHLSEYHSVRKSYNQEYRKFAAGPLDTEFTYDFLNQAEHEGLITFQKMGKLERIKVFNKQELQDIVDRNLSKSLQEEVEKIISHFLGSSMEKPEIVSTLYAVWNNRIIKNELINDELIKKDFLNWSEQKRKYEKKLDKELLWMRKHGIIPIGWGEVI